MNRLPIALLTLVAAFVVDISQTSAQDEFKATPGVTIERDLDFLAAGREEKLDLYRPEKNESNALLPAVLIIHGGGWGKGDKGREREFVSGITLAKAGYVAISVNYERRKGKRWPGNLHDCKNAVRWLRTNAEELGVDSENIGVIGGSAGGHLALMVAYTGDHSKLSPNDLYPDVSDKVSACVDMYGITNLLTRRVTDEKGNPTDELKKHRLFSKNRDEAPVMWRNASPVTYIDANTPPTLILHGTKDKTVDRDQSKELYAALQNAGVESELKMIEGAGHAWPLKNDDFDLRSDVVAFFDKHLKTQATPRTSRNRASKLAQGDRPNVLFIAVDDLNDWQGALNGHPLVKTPNMDRLFKQGVLFTNAHCSQAVCNASRNSVLSGLHPCSSGWYGSTKIMRASYKDVMRDHTMMPQFFRDSGYHTMTAGKIYHQGASDFPDLTDRLWDEIAPGYRIPRHLLERGDGYGGRKFYPFPKNGSQMSRQLGEDYKDGNSLCYGALDREDMPGGKMYDELIAEWAVGSLKKDYEKPFFMAVGFVRPHVPFTAPKEFFDLYKLEDIKALDVPENEMSDIPMMGKSIAYGRLKGGDDHAISKVSDTFSRELILGYLACVSFVDAQIGKVADALEASDYADNTVIVLWSDHGQHLGEKRRWRKQTLWEEATQVPLFFKAPGNKTTPSKNDQVVSLLDIYPTLVDLCGLPVSDRLEGESLIPLFKDPKISRSRPVVSGWYYGNLAVRSNRYRYIRYRDGSGELYDHQSDPGEHRNLIDLPESQQIIAEHEGWLPIEPALPAGSTTWKADKLDRQIERWQKNDSVPDWLK
ncbi:sulfatase-like hydrolase/transferase [Mariniblastus fucicola]|uniref:Arylsulfatase n=1 Tax=Mariniblastus fucicola TaxID=980251 RepID=A0A5B9PEP6_9BACT|nr:sulfatase-like hydrolase/transferase [Mariniblastus fucicola]QEG24888.1 Arylsulfatase [Mariniblastus fucicola]